MSASASTLDLPKGKVSREAYREWAMSQPRRFERIDGEIVAMAPERKGHVLVKYAVYLALRRAIAAACVECEALGDGLAINTPESDYEPDASVNRGTMADGDTTVPNPVIAVEVSSPTTASTDTGAKLAGYFQVASIEHYLIVHPSKPQIIHHRRVPDGIATRILTAGEFELDPPGLVIAVEECYALS